MFQKSALIHVVVHSRDKKTFSEMLKTWYCFYSAFWLTGQGGYSPPGYATGWLYKYHNLEKNNQSFSFQIRSASFTLCFDSALLTLFKLFSQDYLVPRLLV